MFYLGYWNWGNKWILIVKNSMLKYTNTEVTFREVPDEISLCINISGCKNKCPGCHSEYLQQDIGELLDITSLIKLVQHNQGITCVCFMGGDHDTKMINSLAKSAKHAMGLKVAWYSGNAILSEHINPKYFNYIKLGPYIESRGPLDNPNTNQRLFKIYCNEYGIYEFVNITHKFWKK